MFEETEMPLPNKRVLKLLRPGTPKQGLNEPTGSMSVHLEPIQLTYPKIDVLLVLEGEKHLATKENEDTGYYIEHLAKSNTPIYIVKSSSLNALEEAHAAETIREKAELNKHYLEVLKGVSGSLTLGGLVYAYGKQIEKGKKDAINAGRRQVLADLVKAWGIGTAVISGGIELLNSPPVNNELAREKTLHLARSTIINQGIQQIEGKTIGIITAHDFKAPNGNKEVSAYSITGIVRKDN